MRNSCANEWYTNDTKIPDNTAPTLREEMRTFKKGQRDNKNPWGAPGAAKVYSPCGINGANPFGCPVGNKENSVCAYGGFPYGADAVKYFADRKVAVTNWEKGSVQNVAFAMLTNHGGGYQYRLCKVPADGRANVTEECFQKTPLEFFGSSHRIAWDFNETSWKEIPAMDSNIGMKPKGSTWRRNPIPNCEGAHGGGLNDDNSCPQGTQFPAPGIGLHGFGKTPKRDYFKWAVVDRIKVPTVIPIGHYVLSWRWDVEQINQIWNSCAAIKITEPKNPSPDPRISCKVVFEKGITYRHNDINDGQKLLLKSKKDCSKKCLERIDCVGFVWVKNRALGKCAQSCWLKHKLTNRDPDDNCIAGKVVCNIHDGTAV